MMESTIVALLFISVVLFLFGVFLTIDHYKRRRVQLTVLDVKPEPARNRPDIEYKSKLRVALRNDSRQIIVVRAPEWECDIDDYIERVPWWSCLQLECGQGWRKNQWANEAEEIHVRPNQVFLASVALDPSISDDDVRRRLVRKRLGTLVLPLSIAGHEVKQRIGL